MHDKPRILLVEDSLPLAKVYQQYLGDEMFELSHADTGELAKAAIISEVPDLVLLDLLLPDMNGQEILGWIRQEGFPCSVIVLTGQSSIDIAVDVMRLGADDFLEKPVNANRLKTTVHNTLEKHRLKYLVEDYQNSFDRKQYHGFIGSSLPMQAVYRIIDAAASSKASIFITGESGTGKEVCAEAIHQQGDRADKPFIALNCAAIPHDLMESEIFGHVKGAFTGASTDRQGAASLANGGTLFLDEIAEMDMALQSKLLRFIQTSTFQQVGSSKNEQVDVRFICATNRDPLQAVADGKLREDLYYRLHVIPIHLPPLRERGEDILAIASSFLYRYAEEEGKKFSEFTTDVESILSHYKWPGNVRQLQNVIHNIVILHQGPVVSIEHLSAPLDQLVNEQEASSDMTARGSHLPGNPEPTCGEKAQIGQQIRPLAEVEREVIERAITLCGDNIAKAAALLDVSPSTIYRKKQAWDN